MRDKGNIYDSVTHSLRFVWTYQHNKTITRMPWPHHTDIRWAFKRAANSVKISFAQTNMLNVYMLQLRGQFRGDIKLLFRLPRLWCITASLSHVCMNMCAYVWICVHMYEYVCIRMYEYVCICSCYSDCRDSGASWPVCRTYVCICVHMYVCVCFLAFIVCV
jgi:hypothetical protein